MLKKEVVEKWGIFEFAEKGKTEGNPFVDYNIQGIFSHKNESVTVDGFYDGDGIYKVRFMPAFEGKYTYKIGGTFSETEFSGEFDGMIIALETWGENTFFF